MILDSTCSYKRRWPSHATIRIDNRPETNPDIVMDAKDLKFPNNYFDIVYCDPPHIYRKSSDLTNYNAKRRLLRGSHGMSLLQKFSFWQNEKDWLEFINKTNKEFYRCLKPNGLLYYKMTENKSCTDPDDLIKRMTNFKLINDRIEKSKTNFNKKSPSKVHWMTFTKEG